MTQTPTDALRLVPIEMVKAWKKKAENRFMTSSLNEYCPEEFLTLADAYIALAAAPASPLPGGGDILWMMHVRGPDDIYPAPDYETAVAWCDYVNDVLAKAVLEVMTKAVPAIWTGTPESHADGLPEAIKGWTLPAAPTGDAK